jgi:tripartite-type tricarboxylate transporter receptor subunit TctC
LVKLSATTVLACVALSQTCVTGHAQSYPAKPIRYIVPFPPGGGSDLVARSIAQKLTDSAGMQVLVDNRPGAGTIVGAEAAAHSAPDGYTIFMGSNTTNAINPNLYPKLREETQSWLMRLAMNIPTVHATAAEGHERLMLAKAYDLSTRLKAPVSLPISPHDEKRALK